MDYIQDDASGGSGYDSPTFLVNISKTGGLLLELAAIGAGPADARVVAAVNYINSQWNTLVSGWDGNFNNAYAMWAVYKGLQVLGYWPEFDCAPGMIRIGVGIPAAPGGFPICFSAAPAGSSAGDWYSHYCNYLVDIQNPNGSWNGSPYWWGALATGWYINILNAIPVPPKNHKPVCDDAYPSIAELWPPNHEMEEISILGVTDEDGDPITITVTGITQDEPVDALGDGHTAPDGAGVGTATAMLRAERSGRGDNPPGNGRVYRISFVASDGKEDGVCTGSVSVCVPHDQSVAPIESWTEDSRELVRSGQRARNLLEFKKCREKQPLNPFLSLKIHRQRGL